MQQTMSPPRPSLQTKQTSYERMGIIGAHTSALLFWFFLWSLNGASTILPFYLAAQGLGWLYQGIFIGIGASLHIGTSLIEHHLWKSHDRAMYPLIFLVGLFDVATATVALLFVLSLFHIDVQTTTAYIICVGIAETVAIASEPMIVRHRRYVKSLLERA